MPDCPCGSHRTFESCCGPYLQGRHPAPTAEALMRSRYTAYTLVNTDYLHNTCESAQRDASDAQTMRHHARQLTWLRLDVLNVIGGGIGEVEGEVVYIAHYRENGIPKNLSEHAVFRKTGNHWYYAGPKLPTPVAQKPTKIGRNDPCPCGSGKKSKKCCAPQS